jgi:hypothetical protein
MFIWVASGFGCSFGDLQLRQNDPDEQLHPVPTGLNDVVRLDS